ncbi:hypothetical protein [Microbulbifer sp. THAF38]|uniref:hypothetical protein n=1 Tax=Microbulbifer sp. THAF38 TaxID=2587856 RepID=UPI001267933A|nr:hypothetical protein [Microbulbifer sp. THAF38]QFT55615.1 hypothetical protein FIU95_13755 [Microbulbifer sp. THAF38]
MKQPRFENLLEQWKQKATEIAGTSEGFTFHESEMSEFLHWMFSQFQAFAESEQSNQESSVAEFINKAVELENHYPFLYVEIARSRITDWMAWLKDKPGSKLLLACGSGSTAEEACRDALDYLAENTEVASV